MRYFAIVKFIICMLDVKTNISTCTCVWLFSIQIVKKYSSKDATYDINIYTKLRNAIVTCIQVLISTE